MKRNLSLSFSCYFVHLFRNAEASTQHFLCELRTGGLVRENDSD